MVRRANRDGFQLVHVHDNFFASPKYMNLVRRNYIEILIEIAESNLLADTLSEITGTEIELIKDSDNLGDLIRESEYALS